MVYDKIYWHSEGDFPKELSFENGGTHIGMFLAWSIINGLVGTQHVESSKESVNKVKGRIMTGRDFLIKECDAKFWAEDLNEEGNDFAKYYFGDENGYGMYVDDYSGTFNNYETLYHVEDNWSNYDLISSVISKRYNDWKIAKGY